MVSAAGEGAGDYGIEPKWNHRRTPFKVRARGKDTGGLTA